MPPVDTETQAVLFNAVPLLIVAALYLAVGVARLGHGRKRERECGENQDDAGRSEHGRTTSAATDFKRDAS